MPRVTFQPTALHVDVPEGTSLLEAALEAGVTVVECCGITPACGLCRTAVLEGEENLSPPDAIELARRKRLFYLPGDRFGCMAMVQGDVEVQVAR